MSIDTRYNSLRSILKTLGRVAVAYSGGVDSTFLLRAAIDALGAGNVIGCIGVSASLAASQKRTALDEAAAMGARVIEVVAYELEDEKYAINEADRCFYCKSHLYSVIAEAANNEGFAHVVCGSNVEDMDDYRPGNRAAEVLGVRAPLMEAGLSKADIRQLSRRFGLGTADMPASPCLASRISYGVEVTAERLGQVEMAEEFLRGLGFVEFRVRHHGQLARIEVCGDDIERIASAEVRGKVAEKLKKLGFKFVAVDLEGFRSGALNEVLSDEEKQKHV